MKVRITRGTNPTLRMNLKGTTLSTTYIRDSVTDYSYVTIRKNLEAKETLLDEDELQIKIDSSGESTDTYGNTFKVGNDYAELSLSRQYTKKLNYDQYSLQFNLIDNKGRLFTHKPINLEVLYDIAKFTDGERA